VYWGTQLDNYPNSKLLSGAGAPSSAVIDQLTPGTWYFVVTAVNTLNQESGFSASATKMIQ
jgi:hypothetical protein